MSERRRVLVDEEGAPVLLGHDLAPEADVAVSVDEADVFTFRATSPGRAARILGDLIVARAVVALAPEVVAALNAAPVPRGRLRLSPASMWNTWRRPERAVEDPE